MMAFLLLGLPLLVAYAPTLVWVWESWMLPDSYYAHGPLLPLVAAVAIWLRRRELAGAAGGAQARGWLLLGPGLLLHLCGAALTIDSLSAASLLLTAPGAVWLAAGSGRLRMLWPVLGLLLFALPMPMFVSGRAAFELKEIAVTAALGLANLFGADVARTGAHVTVLGTDGTLEVADACSGLRSLVALATLGYCVAFFAGPRRGLRPWVLVAVSLPIAVAANILRIAGICLVGRHSGVEAATGSGHDLMTAGAWVFALIVLLAADAALLRRRRSP
jgi:exosortase